MAKPFDGRAQLSTEVESYVREQILTGEFPAGSRVRAENLAEDLGVSPTPVREALQALRGQGFLSLSPGKASEFWRSAIKTSMTSSSPKRSWQDNWRVAPPRTSPMTSSTI